VAAADDRRRRRARQSWGEQTSRQPAIQRRFWKQPFARHFGARHDLVGHQLVELALGEAQISRRFVGGQEIGHANIPAYL
jgi:hypothetical protein